MFVASFDIGKKNFAFVVQEIDETTLLNNMIYCPAKKHRYNEDGTPTTCFSDFLHNHVFPTSRVVLHDNVDLTDTLDYIDLGIKRKGATGKGASSLDYKIFLEMYTVLDKYIEYWDKCDWFLIEQQMAFGKKVNSMAIKLGQHCISYFISKYRDTRAIIEFPSYHKTKVLGAPAKIIKSERKKWAIDMAVYILCNREEYDWVQFIVKSTKRDDLSDVIVQLEAWKVLYYIDNSPL